MDVATLRLEVLRLTYRKDLGPDENARIADKVIEWVQRGQEPTTRSSPRKRGATEDKGSDDHSPL